MKPAGATKVVAIQTIPEENESLQKKENIKERKSLHPLQPPSTDKENLINRIRPTDTGKDAIKNETKVKGDNKKNFNKTEVKSDISKKSSDKTKTDSKKVQKDSKKEGKIFRDRSVQTESTSKSKTSSQDLDSEAGPSGNYWEVIAERRRIALQDVLEENQMLSERFEVYKEMLEESRALVEVLREMIGEDRSDINNSLDDSAL